MTVAVYGGSFNPPHLGHVEAAEAVRKQLCPDKLLIIPDNIPPHKDLADGSPTAEQRLELCALAFSDVSGAELSDMELRREGKSYTAHTVEELLKVHPEDEIILVIGTDMLTSFEQWYYFEYLLDKCTLAALPREEDDAEKLAQSAKRLRDLYGAKVEIISHQPLPMSSSDIRARLRLRQGADMLDDRVYSSIIRNGYYEALPELCWLREKAYAYLKPTRIAHVAGCESEAVQLARRWGEDEERAATAGILHDITKKADLNEQLILCSKYDIICDNAQMENPALLHAMTGAAMAGDLFGVCDAICEAIRWHTTGKPDMTVLEKIVYLADMIEPTRDFPGVDKLRELAYEDIDKALGLALDMSLREIRSRGIEPYKDTKEARDWYNREQGE